MSPKAISCRLLLFLLLTFFIFRVAKFPRVINAAEEQALIITIPLHSGKTGSADERNKQLYALEDSSLSPSKSQGPESMTAMRLEKESSRFIYTARARNVSSRWSDRF
jgi:hypothetical protein